MTSHIAAAAAGTDYFRTPGWMARCKKMFFPDAFSGIVSVTLFAGLVILAWKFMLWAFAGAVFRADLAACHAAAGACWGIITEKYRLILLGHYPLEHAWRAAIAAAVLAGGVTLAVQVRFWNRLGMLFLLVAGIGAVLLMRGGVFNLAPVGTDRWGGLPLTLMLAIFGCVLATPFGILLALGRRSQLPLVRAICVAYIEIIRGVPLVAWLFFISYAFPLLLPPDWKIDLMLRVGICIVLFWAAYLAEVFRGGLQAIPKGQYEAAHALGMTWWQTTYRIVLPQALRLTIGPAVNIFIGVFKDTSLISIVNLFDLTGSLKMALTDPAWRMFFVEAYLFDSLIYLTIGLCIIRYGRYLERLNLVMQRRT